MYWSQRFAICILYHQVCIMMRQGYTFICLTIQMADLVCVTFDNFISVNKLLYTIILRYSFPIVYYGGMQHNFWKWYIYRYSIFSSWQLYHDTCCIAWMYHDTYHIERQPTRDLFQIHVIIKQNSKIQQ